MHGLKNDSILLHCIISTANALIMICTIAFIVDAQNRHQCPSYARALPRAITQLIRNSVNLVGHQIASSSIFPVSFDVSTHQFCNTSNCVPPRPTAIIRSTLDSNMLLQGLLVTAVTLRIVHNLLLTWRGIRIFPESIPWIGRQEEYLSRLRACAREIFAGLESLKAGYDKVRTLIRL